MIELSTDEPMFTDLNWLVTEGGSFQPDQLVEVYNKINPDQKVAWYASYIKSGEMP
jgi:hypothetical protein